MHANVRLFAACTSTRHIIIIAGSNPAITSLVVVYRHDVFQVTLSKGKKTSTPEPLEFAITNSQHAILRKLMGVSCKVK